MTFKRLTLPGGEGRGEGERIQLPFASRPLRVLGNAFERHGESLVASGEGIAKSAFGLGSNLESAAGFLLTLRRADQSHCRGESEGRSGKNHHRRESSRVPRRR